MNAHDGGSGLGGVSRETHPLHGISEQASPASSYAATAAETAAATPLPDDSTPLAREAQDHVDLARRARSTSQLPRPSSTRVFVVANQKGGVGKTTTAVNVAAALAQKGLRILVVDLDPQGNASTALDIPHSEGTPGVYEALVEDVPMSDLVQRAPQLDGLTVLPATIDLAGAEIELVSLVARETRLKRALETHLDERERAGDRIDYVIIDCPPSLGLLTVNALVAAREVLIPIQCEYYALEGLGQLVRNIELVRAHLNQRLEISTILLTMYDARTRLSAGVAEQVREHFGPKVLATAIPRSVRISEAPSYQQTVLTYDPGSSGALSYLEAAREIAQAAHTSEGDA
ncbi:MULTISPECIES: ParA family protein [unclassified Aeromicrobium]|uniref:ParA family protein n=1 Tax=unclassified Aeromicrobium TaxID=2633570 RepID=UPI0037C0A6F4